jgi:hypothetical protein
MALLWVPLAVAILLVGDCGPVPAVDVPACIGGEFGYILLLEKDGELELYLGDDQERPHSIKCAIGPAHMVKVIGTVREF